MNQKKATSRMQLLSYRSLVHILMFMWVLQVVPAAAHIIHVEWSYSGSAVSYVLYENGARVCTSNDPSMLQMDCDIFLEDTPMVFNLSAVDASGVESPQSAPYTLMPPPKDASGNYLPQADLLVSATTGDAPLSVSFDASASSDIDGIIVNYDWDFGDGEIGVGAMIDHTFSVPGVYTTTLSVIDDTGASSSKTISINVTDPNAGAIPVNEPPKAVITATPMQSGTSDIAFDAYSSSDADGVINSYSWNFGDGDTATGDYVEHKYLAAGDYTVVLTVVDDAGASSQDFMTVSIVDQLPANTLPVAVISASLEQHMVHFDWDYTSDPGLAGFRFYQDGDLVCEIADPAARQADCLAYIDVGQIQMWLSAYDQAGVETDSQMFILDSTGIFDALVSGDAPLIVHFSGGASYDPDGSLVSFAWDFGDGSVAQGQAVDHAFTSAGVYNVTLTVTDDVGDTAQVTHEITVTGIVNAPPTVQPASFITQQDKSVTGTLVGSDPEGDPLTFSMVANGSKGIVTITNSTTGVFTYVPKTGVYGTDAFIFKANDGTNDSSAATVSIDIQKVNQVPVANAQTITLLEDGAFSGSLTATDADGDNLSYSIVANGSKGMATIKDVASGVFSYVPQNNIFGTDSFKFVVNDGKVDSVAATVNITITSVNDAPVASADSLTVPEDSKVSVDLLANDIDVDGDTLTVTALGQPANGTVILSVDKAIYTPKANYHGSDVFTYTITDGQGGTATSSVNITMIPVNDVPAAVDDQVSTEGTVPVNIDLLANDTDVDGDSLKVSSISQPLSGQVAINNGQAVYTAKSGFIGTDSFAYKINDGQGGTATAVASVVVAAPQQTITYSWDYDNTAANLAGFRLYRNGVKICETTDKNARTLTCKALIIDGPLIFAMTAVDTSGAETTLSNNIHYDPIPTAIDLTFSWDYDASVQPAGGFRIYMNGAMICETDDPAVRSLSCHALKENGPKVFYLTAVDANGVELGSSNSLSSLLP